MGLRLPLPWEVAQVHGLAGLAPGLGLILYSKLEHKTWFINKYIEHMELKDHCKANFSNAQSELLEFHVLLIPSVSPKLKIILYRRSSDQITFTASQGIKVLQ